MLDLLDKIDNGQLWQFPGGIHPPGCKEMSNHRPIASIPVPEKLWIPLVQHNGQAGRLLVSSGEHVKKGQPLTLAQQPMAVPIHAPTSGTIGAINESQLPHPSGLTGKGIELIADGEDEWRLRQQRTMDEVNRDEIIRLIRKAGIVGLGGGAFPAGVKLTPPTSVRFLIINGAECEPYITADDRLMQDCAAEILKGIELLHKLIQPERILIAIEDNKPEAIDKMELAMAQSPLAREQLQLRVIPTKYPSGSEKQLIQILTGLQVPQGGLPADLGILMHNVGTCYAVKRAIIDDEPLIERVVTVTGEQTKAPGNYWVRFGTSIDWLLKHTKSEPLANQPLIMGGPMMGFALPGRKVPIVKATNCILMPSLQELPPAKPARNCIRCGDCAKACPQSLQPQQLFWHSQAKEYDQAKKLNLFDCIECGICAAVCPSDIPLVHQYRIAKAELKEEANKAAKAELAKKRFEARQQRLEREKLQRESRKPLAPKAKATPEAVAAALARVKSVKPVTEPQTDMATLRQQRKEQARAAKQAKQQQASSEPKPTETKPASNPAVAAAIARAKAQKEQKAQTQDQAKTDVEPLNETKQASADPRKVAVADAVARAKAKKAGSTESKQTADPTPSNYDPRKAAVAAAIARAKAKKDQQEAPSTTEEKTAPKGPSNQDDPKKTAIAAAIARAKAKKAQADKSSAQVSAGADTETTNEDPRKAAVAAAIARAKAKKAQADKTSLPVKDPEAKTSPTEDPRKAAVAAAIAKAKAKKAKEEQQ